MTVLRQQRTWRTWEDRQDELDRRQWEELDRRQWEIDRKRLRSIESMTQLERAAREATKADLLMARLAGDMRQVETRKRDEELGSAWLEFRQRWS